MTIYNFAHTPIYAVGDTVFYVSTQEIKKILPCPDCLGQGQWKTTSPVGIEYSFSCPRCSNGYFNNDPYSLIYYEVTTHIRKRTIGSIRIDTAEKEHPIEYMCVETGVGSGTIYKEIDLYGTRGAAELYGEQLVAKENKRNPKLLEKYNARVSLSAHNLHLIPKEVA